MIREEEKKRTSAHHIFAGSIAMIGVSLTIITLFKITDYAYITYLDELLGVDSFVFIISSLISYLSLRKTNHKRLELIADSLFFAGMLVLVIIGLFLVFTTW